MSNMKRCSNCGEWKPIDDFHKDSRAKDGHCYHCKECACKRSREWHHSHKERARENGRRYRNGPKREENLRKKREYHWNHREEVLARSREYYHENLKERRAAGRASYRRHRKERMEAARDYLRTPDGRAAARRAKARRRAYLSVSESTLTAEEWRQIRGEHPVCAYCGHRFTKGVYSKHGLTMDHVIPLSRGGLHQPDNVLPVYRYCNIGKSDRLLGEWLPFPWYVDGIHRYDGRGIGGEHE